MTEDRELRRTLRLREVRRDVDEELLSYFEQAVSDLERRGLTREQAEAEAHRRFGDVHQYRQELIDIDRDLERRRRWRDRLHVLPDAFLHARRSMAHAPGLSLGIVLAFALGIGANATVFGMVDRLLLRPPPGLSDPGTLRVYTVQSSPRGRETYQSVLSYPDLEDLRATGSIAGSAGYNFAPRDLTVGRDEGAQRVKGLMVSGDYFRVLGVAPAAGRLIIAADDREDAERVVVLSHSYWQAQYGGAADAIGRTIDFGQGPHRIIGVTPRGFTGVDLTVVDLWLPIVPFRAAIEPRGWQQSRFNQWLKIVVRLSPSATDAAAEAELTTRFRSIYLVDNAGNAAFGDVVPIRYPEDARVTLASVIPGRSPLAPAEVNVARWLILMAIVVLAIASLNVSNLLLSRAIGERRTLGIRLALGAARRRLIAQTVFEAVLLAAAGGAAALFIARYGGTLMQRTFLPTYAWRDIGSSGAVLWITAALAALAGCAAAVLPAMQIARSDVRATLRATAGSIAGGRARLRAGLVTVQVALSVVLLVGASLFVRSFRGAAQSDLGIDPDGAWFMDLVTDTDFDEPRAAYAQLVATLQGVPGVHAAAASSTRPFYNRSGRPFRLEGWDSIPGRVYYHEVLGDYFGALGLGLLSGRGFDPGPGPVARETIVNAELERRLFPAGALGRCLYVGDSAACSPIVGVVETARLEGIRADASMQFYVDARHPDLGASNVEVLLLRRAEGADPARLLPEARRAVAEADPLIRYVEVTAARDQLEDEMRSWRLGALLFSTFGVLALVLAAAGLHAVISFDVSQQLRELGLRAALGASSKRLLGTVMQRAAVVTAVGLAIGLTASVALAPRLTDLVFEISPRDPASLALVGLLLMSIATLSAVAPALRAARVDPLQLLRLE